MGVEIHKKPKDLSLRLIRKTETLGRIFPTLDLRIEEKVVWYLIPKT